MRNKHGKGKIHPSPSQQAPTSPGDSWLSALSLLPAAILTLTAGLCIEDKEVLAYFITRSLVIGSGEATEQSRRKGGKSTGAAGTPAPHLPRFDCGCFGCYTSFWIRWGSSPHGEAIHQAIEAFEKHLAEREGEGATAARRDKERRGSGVGEKKDNKGGRKGKKKKKAAQKEEEEAAGGVVAIAEDDAAAAAAEGSSVVDSVIIVQPEVAVVTGAGGAAELEAGTDDRPVMDGTEWSEDVASEDGGSRYSATGPGEKKKPWLDVMGFLNSRLWSLWSPTA